jgi:hypothetical protein
MQEMRISKMFDIWGYGRQMVESFHHLLRCFIPKMRLPLKFLTLAMVLSLCVLITASPLPDPMFSKSKAKKDKAAEIAFVDPLSLTLGIKPFFAPLPVIKDQISLHSNQQDHHSQMLDRWGTNVPLNLNEPYSQHHRSEVSRTFHVIGHGEQSADHSPHRAIHYSQPSSSALQRMNEKQSHAHQANKELKPFPSDHGSSSSLQHRDYAHHIGPCFNCQNVSDAYYPEEHFDIQEGLARQGRRGRPGIVRTTSKWALLDCKVQQLYLDILHIHSGFLKTSIAVKTRNKFTTAMEADVLSGNPLLIERVRDHLFNPAGKNYLSQVWMEHMSVKNGMTVIKRMSDVSGVPEEYVRNHFLNKQVSSVHSRTSL